MNREPSPTVGAASSPDRALEKEPAASAGTPLLLFVFTLHETVQRCAPTVLVFRRPPDFSDLLDGLAAAEAVRSYPRPAERLAQILEGCGFSTEQTDRRTGKLLDLCRAQQERATASRLVTGFEGVFEGIVCSLLLYEVLP